MYHSFWKTQPLFSFIFVLFKQFGLNKNGRLKRMWTRIFGVEGDHGLPLNHRHHGPEYFRSVRILTIVRQIRIFEYQTVYRLCDRFNIPEITISKYLPGFAITSFFTVVVPQWLINLSMVHSWPCIYRIHEPIQLESFILNYVQQWMLNVRLGLKCAD